MKNTIFYNSDYIVIEYMDLIKSPMLVLLYCMRNNDKLKEIMKLEQLDNINMTSLTEWYNMRNHYNFLLDLNKYPDKISEHELDKLLDIQLSLSDMFYKQSKFLPISSLIKSSLTKKITQEIIIYHPYSNDYAKKDMVNYFGRDFRFFSNFEEMVNITKENTTYFFSDIRNIEKLKNCGYLKFSSITIPIEYRYNKKNMTDFNIEFDELFKEYPFKLSFLQACSI